MIEVLAIYFSLVLARIGLFVAVMPVIGGTQTPRMVKVGLCMALAWMWSLTLLDQVNGETIQRQAVAVSWLGWGLALGREAALGAALGFLFSLLLVPARVAGEFIAQEMGLSFGNELTAAGAANAGIMPVTLELFAGLLFFGMNAHHWCFRVLDTTFHACPVGEPFRLPSGDWIGYASAAQEQGLAIAAPVAICLFLSTVVLALMARATPQLNLFSVGFPLRIVIGLAALLFFLPHLMTGIAQSIARLMEWMPAVD